MPVRTGIGVVGSIALHPAASAAPPAVRPGTPTGAAQHAVMDGEWLATGGESRVLWDGPPRPGGALVALHGYGQLADAMAEAFGEVTRGLGWGLCCVEARHRFYLRGSGGVIGASWMTAHGRAADIAANRAWLGAVLERCRCRWDGTPVVVLGFSQGASQAWRCAHALEGLAGIVAIGGDIPPEHRGAAPARPPPALVVRGREDRSYDPQRLAADRAVLGEQGWPHRVEEVAGGHRLGPGPCDAVARWLGAEIRGR